MRLVFIRHSHSISNEMRDLDKPGSQDVRDPGLSKKGMQEAKAYGPQLRRLLQTHGVDLSKAVFASSPLRRARQTLGLLFPGRRGKILTTFGENGAIPENTPAGQRYQKPDLEKTLTEVKQLGDTIIIIGHGSFITSTVWPTFVGTHHNKFQNLDAFTVDTFRPTIVYEFPHLSRMTLRKTKKTVRKRRKTQRRQRGGGFPLSYFSPGDTQGYAHAPSGHGLEGSNSTWVRTALNSTH